MKLKDFEIEFLKFKEGIHHFSYSVSSDFFQLFEDSSLNSGNFQVAITFEKKVTSLELDFNVIGTIDLPCDRCLTIRSYPIENDFKLHVKITENTGEEEENLTYILPSESSFNIASYIYEIIYLSIPMRKICEEIGEQCEEDTIKRFKEIAIGKEVFENNESNPEWDKLKNILNNLK